MGLKRIQLVVRGRVQGVFFRASAQREARQNALTGWVKNRPDGAVEMVVEGEEDNVKDFLAWAQNGPSTARVDKVETRWRSYTGEFAEFRIISSG
jgi:acylphosphatase